MIRYYFFPASRYTLEHGPGYVKIVNLDTRLVLLTSSTRLVGRWKLMRSETKRISEMEYKKLIFPAVSFNSIKQENLN